MAFLAMWWTPCHKPKKFQTRFNGSHEDKDAFSCLISHECLDDFWDLFCHPKKNLLILDAQYRQVNDYYWSDLCLGLEVKIWLKISFYLCAYSSVKEVYWNDYRRIFSIWLNCSLHTENVFDNLTRTALHSIMDFLYNKQRNKMQLAQSGSLWYF